MSPFSQPVAEVAKGLIGARLLIDGVGGRIVETEAYDVDDPASHSFKGPSARNRPMFGFVGHAYVYTIYGLHACFNIVAGDHPGAAVLIRAIEPLVGLDVMRARRGVEDVRHLCAGPGRLCQAMGITTKMNGKPLSDRPFSLQRSPSAENILVGQRIGISKAKETSWRFGLALSPYLSREFSHETRVAPSQQK